MSLSEPVRRAELPYKKYRRNKMARGEVQVNLWLMRDDVEKLDIMAKKFGNRSLAVEHLLSVFTIEEIEKEIG